MKLPVKTFFAAPLLGALLLAGCATPAISPGTATDPGTATSASPTADAGNTPVLVDGEAAPPGTKVGFDTYLTYSYVTTDKEDALLKAKLDSIEPATADELAVLTTNFGDKLDPYDIYLLRMTEKKVSGATVKYNDDWSFFDVVDAQGERIQSISLIGWDGCDTQSFSEDYDTGGAEIAQCYIGAVKKGSAAPGGMAYTGGYEDDNPYDAFSGKPLLFIP
ncbi:MAG: hypothetical protein ABIR17_09645 [Pseudolysinimonas sp.]|uniref:hypothetical protein n=1 Tax=Pseudolysinimonas sp. TaxID=2680009 RepID=UPI003263B69F